jgi:membrane-associated protease RseP (regulator of RpoE activity)
MERRLMMFFVVSFALMVGYTILMQKMRGKQDADNPPAVAQADKKDADKGKEKADAKKSAEKKDTPKSAEKDPLENKSTDKAEVKAEDAVEEAAEPTVKEEYLTLGSVDPDGPYRMMPTFTNRGAALARIELSSEVYRDIDTRSGYLGHVMTDRKSHAGGCPVQLVGPGTPAEKAGLKVGDIIKSVNSQTVVSIESLETALQGKDCKPGRTIELQIVRDGKPMTLQPELTRHPLEVIRPAADDPIAPSTDDPLSLLMTMQQIDNQTIPDDDKILKELEGKKLSEDETNKEVLDRELKGVALRDSVWKIVEADREHVVFRQKLSKYCLEIYKTYRLKKVPGDALKKPDFPGYHLTLEIKIVNYSNDKDIKDEDPRKNKVHEIAYRLDGPNGLPTEGYWYANKVCPNWWQSAGLRDVVVSFDGGDMQMATCMNIPNPKKRDFWVGQSVTYIGVDAQYFSAVLGEKAPRSMVRLLATSVHGKDRSAA